MRFRLLIFVLLLASFASATGKRKPAPAPAAPNKAAVRKQFALDVLKNAVALPVADPQDRLRVLTTAVAVARPLAPAMTKQLLAEGARIEADLIAHGTKPEVSVLNAADADCGVATRFVESVPAANVVEAEDSLLAAFSVCPKQTLPSGRRQLTYAVENGQVAPRALLALIEADGATSQWSQSMFTKVFASLPRNDRAYAQAQDFGQMFVRFTEVGAKDDVRDAGVKLLDWLAQVPEGGAKNLTVSMVTDAFKKALGDEGYQAALRTDPVAQSLANSAGQPGDVTNKDEEEATPVMQAMGQMGADQTKRLSALPPSQRARESAAAGFAAGTSGDRTNASHYFDMAYSALEQVWSARTPKHNAAAVVEEVSEAAAHVDPVAALKRAQGLQDPTAQAIAMLAVARVVAYAQ